MVRLRTAMYTRDAAALVGVLTEGVVPRGRNWWATGCWTPSVRTCLAPLGWCVLASPDCATAEATVTTGPSTTARYAEPT